MTQENFEKYLALLKGLLKLRDSQKEEIASELRDHLEQRVEELESSGLDPDEAELAAIKEFGDAAGMASSFINISRFRKQRWMMRFTTFAIAGCFVVAVFLMSMWPQNGPVKINSAGAQTDPPAKVAGSKTGTGAKDIGSVSKSRTMLEDAAYQALDETIETVSVVEIPLSEVLAELSEKIGVSILVNKQFLEESGDSLDAPVTLQIKNAKLTTILDIIFRDQLENDDWVYGIKDSFIYISSNEYARELMEVRVYDCNDFAVTATYKVPVQSLGFGGFGGGLGGGGLGGHGGGGQGGGGQGGGLFNVISSPITQGLGVQSGGGGVGDASYPRPEIIQGGTKNVQIGAEDAQANPDTNPKSGYKTFETQDLGELVDCIQVTIDPENWENMGGVATLSQVGTAIVVNQTIENHRKIEELLVMLRKIKSLKK